MDRFENLKTFVTVIESGSFSSAAAKLECAKSVVSRRIGELEAHLGVQLLTRTTRRQNLTDSGRVFYPRAKQILQELEDAEQGLIQSQGALRGRIRFTSPLSFGLGHLMPLITAFSTEHSDVELDISFNDDEVDIIKEGFDLALRIGRLVDSTLIAKKLTDINMVVCASPDYLERHGTPSDPHELVQHQGLHYSRSADRQHWRFTDPQGTAYSVKVPSRLRSDNGDALVQAAVAGLGVLITPTFIAYRELAAGQLRPLLTDHPLAPVGLYIVYPSREHQPRRVRALIDYLSRHICQQPYWESTHSA